jgi:hypothetical protein
MTSTPGGSAKCSQRERQPPASEGVAASAGAARGRLGVEPALKLHETPELRCPPSAVEDQGIPTRGSTGAMGGAKRNCVGTKGGRM